MAANVAEGTHTKQVVCVPSGGESAIFPVLPMGYKHPVGRRNSDKKPDNTLAKWVREQRQERGWTQQQLADKARVGRETIANWERGAKSPSGKSFDKVRKILIASGVAANYEQVEPTASVPAGQPVYSDGFMGFLDAIRDWAKVKESDLMTPEFVAALSHVYDEAHRKKKRDLRTSASQ